LGIVVQFGHEKIAMSALAVALVVGSFSANPASAKKFKNCTELRKTYPNGVAKSAKSAGSTGAKVSSKIYAENKTSDRDGDGIACEKA